MSGIYGTKDQPDYLIWIITRYLTKEIFYLFYFFLYLFERSFKSVPHNVVILPPAYYHMINVNYLYQLISDILFTFQFLESTNWWNTPFIYTNSNSTSQTPSSLHSHQPHCTHPGFKKTAHTPNIVFAFQK